MPPSTAKPSTPSHSPLPDFCSLPVISALLVVGALCVTLAWLAPESTRGWRGYSVGMVFVEWTAMVMGVALCKLRPWLLRLPGLLPYAGVWLVMVAIVTLASLLALWMDRMLNWELIVPASMAFVRDNAVIAALLGAAMLRYFYVLAEWQARLAAVAHARVEALQARIRPHFLFNSMNTVAALVRVDPVAAERTVENLSELFRAALGQQDTHSDTLGEELQLVDRYLAIEQLALGRAFAYATRTGRFAARFRIAAGTAAATTRRKRSAPRHSAAAGRRRSDFARSRDGDMRADRDQQPARR
jgi:two-component system sensor histidine kinase AlgZ